MVGNLKKLKVFFSTENSSLPKALDWFLDGALIFLIIFTPLAVGSVGLISRSIMIFVIALIFLAWVIMQLLEGKKIFFPSAIIVSLLVFSFLVLLQLISLPASLVDFLSPKASLLHGALALTEPSSAVFFQLSINPHATLSELMRLLSCVIIFYVIINHYNTKDKILRLITIIVCVGLFISLVALFQKLFWNGKLLWFIPVNSTRSPDMTFFWGPFVNHNHFAGFLLMIIPLSFGLLLSKFEKLRTLPGVTLGKRLVRITESREFLPIVLISLSCIIMTGMLLMTLSRGGFIGFAVALVTFSVLAFIGGLVGRRLVFVLSALGVIVFILVVLVAPRLEHRFSEIDTEKIPRVMVWKDTLRLAKDFPVLGSGLGTFKDIYPAYQSGYGKTFFSHAENDYLEVLCDTGFVGFFLLLFTMYLYFSHVYKAWKRRRNTFVKIITVGGLSSCVAIAVHGLTDFNMRIPSNALLLAIISALTYATVFNLKTKKVFSKKF